MRDIRIVINEIQNALPKRCKELRDTLDDIIDSVNYAAPEMIGFWWSQLQETLYSKVPSDAKTLKKHGYELKVWSIFSTMSEEEIIKSLN